MSKTIGIVLALQDKCSPKMKEIAQKIGVTENKLKRASRTLQNFSNKLNNGLKNACKVATVGLTAVAGATIVTLNKTREYADKIDDMSKKIGLSKKSYQEWDYIINRFGGNVDGLQMGMKSLVNQVVGANSGNKNAINNFKMLGISIKDANGNLKNQEVLFEEVVSSLQKYPDGAMKAKLANDLFGRSGSDLMPMFKENSQAISELKKEMQELGLVMSDEQIESANTFSDNIETIQKSLGMVMMSLGAELIPVLNDLSKTFISNMPQIRQAVVPILQTVANSIKFVINNIGILLPLTTGLVSAFVAFKTISGVIATINALKNAIAAVNIVQGIWNALMLANPIGLIASGVGLLIGGITLLVMNWDKVTNAVKIAIDAIKNFLHIKPKKIKVESETTQNQIVNGSHANGLDYVPFDNYIANLHKGERVLTASENKSYNNKTINTIKNDRNININFYGDIIGDESFLQKLENRFTQKLKAELGAL